MRGSCVLVTVTQQLCALVAITITVDWVAETTALPGGGGPLTVLGSPAPMALVGGPLARQNLGGGLEGF